MKKEERAPVELNDDWPEVLYGENDWPDEIPAETASERKEVTDTVIQSVGFLLNEGREFGW